METQEKASRSEKSKLLVGLAAQGLKDLSTWSHNREGHVSTDTSETSSTLAGMWTRSKILQLNGLMPRDLTEADAEQVLGLGPFRV